MKLIVLDRDGVINHDSDQYIKNADQWHPIEGSIEAIAKLSKAGFKIVIATNQSGLARELFNEFDLTQIHKKLCHMVEDKGGVIEGIFYCPHLPEDNCDCRKPKIGLLKQIEAEFQCSLSDCYFIGDSLKDIQAAKKAGCIPILVKTGNGESTLEKSTYAELADVAVFKDLAVAADIVLRASEYDDA